MWRHTGGVGASRNSGEVIDDVFAGVRFVFRVWTHNSSDFSHVYICSLWGMLIFSAAINPTAVPDLGKDPENDVHDRMWLPAIRVRLLFCWMLSYGCFCV